MARYEEYQKEMAYRVYVTDRLWRDDQNRFMPANARFYDWIQKDDNPIDQMSGDEIVANVIAKAGLVVKHEHI